MSSKNTFRILFYLNNSKLNGEGSPIMMRITVNGNKIAIYTRRRILPTFWNSKSGMPMIKDAHTDDIGIYLESLRNKAYNAFTELSREFDEVSPQMIRDVMEGKQGGATQTIMGIWIEHNEELRKLIGKQNSYTLWQKYETCRKHFLSFLENRYRVPDILIKQVRYNVVREFQQYMIADKECSYNTTIKFLQFLKKIVIRAIRSGWLKTDPFQDISLALKETDRAYLTEEELERVVVKHFSVKRLDMVKDLFVFSCYTGLAYSDVKKLKKAELEKTPDGMWWIKTRRQKTKQRSQIPLLEIAKGIIDKHTNLDELRAEDLVFPVMSNQKLNAYLKEVADLCEIEKTLTYHVARHTFATTVTLQNGVSIESVSRMMGHSNIKTTQHYARIVDKKIAYDMIELSKRTRMAMAK
ncbi:MAG TPA: recombinase [Bacteroidetes bacterium]|nr:recombinase [Bacteroidota bacterium]